MPDTDPCRNNFVTTPVMLAKLYFDTMPNTDSFVALRPLITTNLSFSSMASTNPSENSKVSALFVTANLSLGTMLHTDSSGNSIASAPLVATNVSIWVMLPAHTPSAIGKARAPATATKLSAFLAITNI